MIHGRGSPATTCQIQLKDLVVSELVANVFRYDDRQVYHTSSDSQNYDVKFKIPYEYLNRIETLQISVVDANIIGRSPGSAHTR